LVAAEQDLVAAKHRDTQLGFGLLLKFYGRFGQFPRGRAELHDDAVDFVARQLGIDAGSFGFYEWTGRTIKRHRSEIRTHHRFRECTIVDADALTAGREHAQKERRSDCWQIGELLALHPQAAFDAHANLADGTRTPARQRPQLAVVCTAGLAAEHDMSIAHGIDLDDLDPRHSFTTEPTVVRLRAAADLLGDDIWIAVKLPGEYDGDDDLDDDAALRRWATVALHPDEPGWLREALALNAEDPDDEDEDLEPLD
jgi:hypothetical protein